MSTDLSISFGLTSVALWQSHDYTTVYDYTRNILYLTYRNCGSDQPYLWGYAYAMAIPMSMSMPVCLSQWPRLCPWPKLYYLCLWSLTTITISIILPLLWLWLHWANDTYPDSKVHGANMGPTWVLSAPDGPYVGPMNLAIGVAAVYREHNHHSYQIIVRSPKNLSASNHNKTQQSMNHVAISSHAP